MLYFITGNENKLREAQALVENLVGYETDLPEIQEIDPHKIIKAKLLEGLKHKQGELVIEDTSLYMNALNGLPGPLIKWFLKTIGNEGLYEIAKRFNIFSAEAKTLIGYAVDKDNIVYFEGTITGRIVKPRGETNFGWDPIFEPTGRDKTFAEMTQEEKNSISMRKMAFIKLREYLDANK
jgi:inosine triphosphate pyrophosphatase